MQRLTGASKFFTPDNSRCHCYRRCIAKFASCTTTSTGLARTHAQVFGTSMCATRAVLQPPPLVHVPVPGPLQLARASLAPRSLAAAPLWPPRMRYLARLCSAAQRSRYRHQPLTALPRDLQVVPDTCSAASSCGRPLVPATCADRPFHRACHGPVRSSKTSSLFHQSPLTSFFLSFFFVVLRSPVFAARFRLSLSTFLLLSLPLVWIDFSSQLTGSSLVLLVHSFFLYIS
jgi:hypothetical protein